MPSVLKALAIGKSQATRKKQRNNTQKYTEEFQTESPSNSNGPNDVCVCECCARCFAEYIWISAYFKLNIFVNILLNLFWFISSSFDIGLAFSTQINVYHNIHKTLTRSLSFTHKTNKQTNNSHTTLALFGSSIGMFILMLCALCAPRLMRKQFR